MTARTSTLPSAARLPAGLRRRIERGRQSDQRVLVSFCPLGVYPVFARPPIPVNS
ncbi:MAG TPA: hypothetical protein VN520_08500 [Streptomyces sp.]|uniref:hypothetical protein n=1 Tax=Streptomyces sp. TaxID=1931 RepID=UPI002B5EAF56|nr:hypothetical protein [Streptomyces sp.]HWU06406.1 hypothetical protein [Streptomyces sp.]